MRTGTLFINHCLTILTTSNHLWTQKHCILHHTFHHGGAVKGANKDIEMIKSVMNSGDFTLADHWTKKLSFHLSSHILHSIFWTNLANKKSQPTGDLLKRIEKDFGSTNKMQEMIAKISKSIEGSGWGILAYQPYSDNLVVLQCENHHKLTVWGAVPLLVIDVWGTRLLPEI